MSDNIETPKIETKDVFAFNLGDIFSFKNDVDEWFESLNNDQEWSKLNASQLQDRMQPYKNGVEKLKLRLEKLEDSLSGPHKNIFESMKDLSYEQITELSDKPCKEELTPNERNYSLIKIYCTCLLLAHKEFKLVEEMVSARLAHIPYLTLLENTPEPNNPGPA